MQYSLSKSRYCSGVQCPKILWLKENKPEEFDQSSVRESLLDNGQEIGDLAMGLFGDFVEVPYGKPGEMAKATAALMEQDIPIITEASFAYDGCFCSVDILKRLGGNKVEIYEVKSSSAVKEIYRHDVAYQYYVMRNLGYEVAGCYLVHINNNYVRHGQLDLKKLFTIVDVTADTVGRQALIQSTIDNIRTYMEQETEPTDDIGMHCFEPYKCGFFGYCTRHLPKPNVFDVNDLRKKKAMEHYHNGIASFDQLNAAKVLPAKQHMQVAHAVCDCPPHIEVDNLRKFLQKLTYPIYFFDFESFMPAIPIFDNLGPSVQVVFQYSLDYIEYEGGPIHHRDFLAYPGEDPRRALAEQMCADIPKDVCVVTYNMGFEKGRIRELADLFPDLREHLLNIREHIVDLMVPFRSKWYYCRDMQGSYSIKYVLPALFPDDPDLDYHNLEGIHNGGEASATFAKMASMTPEELETTRQQLLTYCGLDTYAMIKIWDKLKDACK